MTRVYSAYAIQDEAPDDFTAVERELWQSIVRELKRFDHENA